MGIVLSFETDEPSITIMITQAQIGASFSHNTMHIAEQLSGILWEKTAKICACSKHGRIVEHCLIMHDDSSHKSCSPGIAQYYFASRC